MFLDVFVPEIKRLVVKRIPNFMLGPVKRHLLKRIKDEVHFEIRNIYPGTINLNATVPTITLWFRLINMSDYILTVDRVLFELWVGQPVIKEAVINKKIQTGPRSFKEDIYFEKELSEKQIDAIRHYAEKDIKIDLYRISVYCSCKLGDFELEPEPIRQVRPEITG